MQPSLDAVLAESTLEVPLDAPVVDDVPVPDDVVTLTGATTLIETTADAVGPVLSVATAVSV